MLIKITASAVSQNLYRGIVKKDATEKQVMWCSRITLMLITLVAMAMMQGLTSAIVNPNDLRLMETIKSCDIFKNNELYSDSYLDA